MLSDAFDVDDNGEVVEPLSVNLPTVPIIQQTEDEDLDIQAQSDIDYTRQNLYQMVEFGKDALKNALAMVQQAESPRAVEAFATLLKSLADANKQIVEVQKDKQQIKQKVTKQNNPQVTNNALFVGSTAELAKMLKGMTNG